MRELLIAEMKRAIELLEASEKPTAYHATKHGQAAECKAMLRNIRKHSIELEKLDSPWIRK